MALGGLVGELFHQELELVLVVVPEGGEVGLSQLGVLDLQAFALHHTLLLICLLLLL